MGIIEKVKKYKNGGLFLLSPCFFSKNCDKMRLLWIRVQDFCRNVFLGP